MLTIGIKTNRILTEAEQLNSFLPNIISEMKKGGFWKFGILLSDFKQQEEQMRKIMCLLAMFGCGNPDETVQGFGTGENHSNLSTGSLQSADGTYGAGCHGRTGTPWNGHWSVAIDSYAGALTYTPLTVVKHDSACVLTLTTLHAGSTVFTGTSNINLTTSYQASGVLFGGGGGSFYANAKISDAAFNGNFSITVLYANDPNAASGSNTANFSSYTGSATSSNVPAPNYTFDPSAIAVTTDANNVVDSVSGNLADTAGSQTGEFYVIPSSLAGTTYAQIDTAYKAGTPVAMSSTIPASSFNLIGVTLPVTKYVLVSHTVSGVVSYQYYALTFNPYLAMTVDAGTVSCVASGGACSTNNCCNAGETCCAGLNVCAATCP